MTDMDRRKFLRGSILIGSTALMTSALGCSSTSADSKSSEQGAIVADSTSWDDEADVIIVGAGGGGLAAAIEASAAGSSVLVLEVMSNTHFSNSALSGGMVQGACTSVQEAAGISDSIEEYDKYLAAVGEGFESTDLRKLFAEKSGETIDWLVEQGVNFTPEMVLTTGTMVDYYTDITPAVARMHWCAEMSGSGITNVLEKVASDQGVRFSFDSQVTRLVTNADGEVIGVRVTIDGIDSAIKANKAVVLATGGYTRNAEMIKDFATLASPGMINDRPIIGSYGSPWQQGDGIKMGQAVGAKLTIPWAGYNVAPGICGDVEKNQCDFLYAGAGIFVSNDGKRHVLETDRPTENCVGEIWAQPEGYVWVVLDQSTLDAYAGTMGGIGMGLSSDLATEIEAGYIAKADSITELAQVLNIDAAALEATIEEYNGYAAAGVDTALGRVTGLTPLATAPFYAGRIGACTPDTAGGLTINTDTQVLNPFNEAIPRLFAVGNTTGGYKGKVNAGCGQALGWTYTSGRIAGQNAANLDSIA